MIYILLTLGLWPVAACKVIKEAKYDQKSRGGQGVRALTL